MQTERNEERTNGKKMNTNNNDILFIGDTIHDCEVANELNIDCIAALIPD